LICLGTENTSFPTYILLLRFADALVMSFWQFISNNKHKIINYRRTSQHTSMTNMSLNSHFDAISNERLLAEIFHVVPKLEWGFWSPPLGTNVTEIGQAIEGEPLIYTIFNASISASWLRKDEQMRTRTSIWKESLSKDYYNAEFSMFHAFSKKSLSLLPVRACETSVIYS